MENKNEFSNSIIKLRNNNFYKDRIKSVLVELYIIENELMILKKKSCPKTAKMIADDIRYSYNKLTSQNNPILSITINNTNCNTAKELRFNLTNRFFNKIHKEHKQSFEVLNYLFVIEYPTIVSMGNFIPNSCKPHTHIILETTLPIEVIRNYIKTIFDIKRKKDIYIENIAKRDDKLNYANYLTKQINILTDDNYNYKINI